MMPKLSCLPVSLYPDFVTGEIRISDWAKAAQKIGLDAIDLSVLMTRRLDAPALAAAAKDLHRRGLPVDTVVTYTDFTHPDAAVRKSAFDQFKADVAIAVLFQATYLRITAGQAHPATSRRKGIELTVNYFNRAAEFARKNHVGLLFENHSKPGVWPLYDFAGEPAVYLEIVDRLDGIAIELLFDTANACFYKQDPVQMLGKILPRVRRIHVADIKKSAKLKPVLIGQGMVPLWEVFKFLKQANYSGRLSIEEASGNGFAGIQKAVKVTRSLWAKA